MNYATEAEADTFLGHSSAWLALASDVKQRHRDAATRWLNFTYEWVGEPEGADEWPRVAIGSTTPALDLVNGAEIIGIPEELKQAESVAALANMTTPLFAAASTASAGGVTKERVKAGSVEVETTYAEATTASSGLTSSAEIDSLIYKFGTRRGVGVGRMVDFL